MKMRHLLCFALAAISLYLLGPGCTQDFGAFQTCEFGHKPCGNECVPMTDPDFGCSLDGCTPCDIPNSDATCMQNACVGSCRSPFLDCDDAKENGCEVDPTTDPANCGACGKTCSPTNAQPACTGGLCDIAECDPGFEDCNSNASDGCEVNTQTDPMNCGTCGTTCPQFQTCQAGKCSLVCPENTGDCDNDPANGCETTFGTTLDCAFCNDECNLAHAAAACTGGKCVVENCQNGFGDCDGVATNGCEADLDNSAMTCGTCNNACPTGVNGTAVCNGGTCAINCDGGFGNCDQNLANGCETDTSTSNQNCGGCNQPCQIANGTGACSSGMCTVTMCNGTFGDCDGNAMNGCETNKNTSAANCGMCGNTCSFLNAAASCQGGACALGNCNMGFGNCNNMAADGCETPTSADVDNCGACGNVCPGAANATATCANGTCGFACDAGFGNCDGNAANGCETNLATNVSHCGVCGRACSGNGVAARSCTAGLCDSSCDLGAANCSMPPSGNNDNGCETNATNSNTNCGGCGNDCSQQGGSFDKLECDGGPGPQRYCGCSNNNECRGNNVPNGAAVCGAAGICTCGPFAGVKVTCNAGEACVPDPNNATSALCSCNAGAACSAGQTCCVSPAGCVDLQTDADSCGACGRACAPGFACAAGGCVCDADADCNAGTPGTCAVLPGGNGRCTCGATQCAVGERCLPNGTCG